MRLTARIEPTKHVMNLVQFAERVIAQVAELGLMPRRHYRRRKKKAKGNPGNPGPKVVTKKPKKAKKVHPLAQTEEA